MANNYWFKMPHYHVRITKKSRRTHDTLELDLAEHELKKRIVTPFQHGESFMCGGEPIDPFDVERIHINKTEEPSGNLLPKIRAERAKSTVKVLGISDEWYVTDEGIDVTKEFITAPPKKAKMISKESSVPSKKVFIVHGRDTRPVKELKAMLSEFGLNPIVLHELPSGSMTIIEKLEKYSEDVGFAFAILTPDDVGFERSRFQSLLRTATFEHDQKRWFLEETITHELKPRTRQNVLLEFGFFIGKLSRSKVCCLYKGNVRLPSDMQGIVYISFENTVNECRDKIIKELKAAGYKIKI